MYVWVPEVDNTADTPEIPLGYYPDKDKYNIRDKKQHNLQQLIKQPGPA